MFEEWKWDAIAQQVGEEVSAKFERSG